MLDSFTVAIKKPPPPVMKASLKEYLLEFIVDADLVCIFHSFLICLLIMSFTLVILPHRVYN